MRRLEIIVLTVEDAMAAEAGGATSVEIVADMSVGGLTPSVELVQAIRKMIKIDLNVMVRPHGRSFVYSPIEREQILIETQRMITAGATGIVFGALKDDRTIDIPLVREVAGIAANMVTTLHRAIDEAADPDPALIALQGTIQRILTSGNTPDVWLGRDTIKRWVETFGNDYTFACGGGVRLENVQALADYTQAPEYHVGSAARTDGKVDTAKVRAFWNAINPK